MKFDICVGNPPYQGNGDPLYMQITKAAYDTVLDENGVMCMINPTMVIDNKNEGDGYYDHFDAINTEKVEDIPDCDLVIGVPVSFIDKWDYRQFDIVDARNYRKDDVFSDMKVQLLCGSGGELSAIKGERKFSRILIKKK